MNRFLVRSWADFGIAVETGASGVELVGDHIAGTWLATPKVVRAGSSRPVSVELLNTVECVGVDRFPEAAVKFTKKFGALTVPYSPGSPFQFSMQDWIVSLRQLQQVWTGVSRASRRTAPINVFVDRGEYFSFEADQLTFRTGSLETFVSLEIASVSAPRLCICANRLHGCKSPFFVADDTREKYCSEDCARAGKRRANLNWWNENRRGK